MSVDNVLLIGGSGFVGSHLTRELSARSINVRVATRYRERARHLLVFPTVEVVEADVFDPAALRRLMDGQDAVVNLVGILNGGNGRPYGRGFARAHVELPRRITAAMAAAGLRRLLHMSALRAAADAPSGYLRSKATGEAVALTAGLDTTVFRPSVIFGNGDSFLSLFERLLQRLPVVPLACPAARFQPVWVEDVAATLADALGRPDSVGAAYDLCGPRQYALRELVAYVAALTGRRRLIVGLPDALSWLQSFLMEFLPGAPMRLDNYRSMLVASVCEAGCSLPLGRRATPLEAVAPGYLLDGRWRAGNDRFRSHARR